MIPQEVIDFLKTYDRFLISSHVNPDGDALGSAMGMKWLLDKMGKQSEIVIDSPLPELYEFFPNHHLVQQYGPDMEQMEKFDYGITVDLPIMERMGKVGSLFTEDAKILVIDHHISEKPFGNVSYIEKDAAATSELIYRIIASMDIDIDADCATYLYTGIVIDTGRFRFSNTSPEALRAAGSLVAAGASPNKIAEQLYYHNTLETTIALGKFINSIKIHLDGKVATAQFDNEYVTSDEWEKVDTEGFVNHALAVRGVEVSVFLREVKPGVVRGSLRAKNEFDVNKLANVFGGGGHAKAAGLTIEEPLEKAESMILEEIKKRLDDK